MNLVNRLQTAYGWTPAFRTVFKKPVPQGLNVKIPQTTGIPGWIVFTYENNIPVCAWISAQECRVLPCIVDERICGDTFLRVEKIGKLEFAVSDIWMYNGNCIFACSTFQQRQDWIQTFLSTFTKCVENVTIDLIHKSDLDMTQIKVRGYEYYSDTIGEKGIFAEAEVPAVKNTVKIKKLSLPDCYQVEDGGYLMVPDLKTSEYLRSLGNEFELPCEKVDDEYWKLIE